MLRITRRSMLAATTASLAAGPLARKPRAAEVGDLSELTLADPPAALPEITFLDASGQPHTLAEFRGRGMVVNLWATWCVPCRAEMPALAVQRAAQLAGLALSVALAPEDIAVLPLSSDRGGAGAVAGFYAQHGITALPVLLDPRGAALKAWGVAGIPVTVLVDREGRERARLEGAADWSSPAAIARVRNLLSA